MESPFLKKSIDPFPDKKRRKKKLVMILFFILAVFTVFFGYIFIKEYNAPKGTHNEIIIQKLSKLIILPDENPDIATISDVKSLKESDSEFYKDSKDGDQLILYTSKAIIFREDQNIIVNVAPIIKE